MRMEMLKKILKAVKEYGAEARLNEELGVWWDELPLGMRKMIYDEWKHKDFVDLDTVNGNNHSFPGNGVENRSG